MSALQCRGAEGSQQGKNQARTGAQDARSIVSLLAVEGRSACRWKRSAEKELKEVKEE